ncbi:MAG: SprB repeat-containing protein [Chitinophagales bacterium]
MVITAAVNNASCNGNTNGAIDITVTGSTGAGTYSYQWNTSATTEPD